MGRIAALKDVVAAVEQARASGERIVLTNGAFDLLHVGHVRYLHGAAQHGDVLVVAVNSDASVRRAKGSERPMVPADERAELVAAVEGVDWVLLFEEDTVESVLTALRPNYHAKGTDYTTDSVPEAELVRSLGGEVVIVGDPKDHSTTEMVSSLQKSSAHLQDSSEPRPTATRMGVPVVVSAPSGAGKTTLCRELVRRVSGVEFSISHTTRAPRGHERDGHDYHFVDDATFDAMVEAGEFLEWAHVHGHRYGTGRAAVEKTLGASTDLLFDIDVQGGKQIHERLDAAVLVFIVPPDWQTLESRLRGRKSDSQEQIERRLGVARREVEQASFYTYWVINDDLEAAVDEFRSILLSHRLLGVDKRLVISKFMGGES